jgi:hypothetical protein
VNEFKITVRNEDDSIRVETTMIQPTDDDAGAAGYSVYGLIRAFADGLRAAAAEDEDNDEE